MGKESTATSSVRSPMILFRTRISSYRKRRCSEGLRDRGREDREEYGISVRRKRRR